MSSTPPSASLPDRSATVRSSPTGPVGDAIVERIVRLARVLRAGGAVIALSEVIDAERAAGAVDVTRRNDLRLVLRATLLKDTRHHEAFDAAFDRLFPERLGRPSADGRYPPATDREAMAAAVAGGEGLDDLAFALVDEHAGLDGELRGEQHHTRRVYRAADLARLMSDARRVDPEVPTEELRARIEEMKRLIAADIGARLDPGAEVEALDSVADVEFLRASRRELDAIRDAVRPLARRLAARLARQRRAQRSGRVNFRATSRKALGTGGVPFDVVVERPRPRRPELFVLCDVSGSVADFAVFTLTLMASLSLEIGRTRSFLFADAVDEVTDLLTDTDHGIEPWQLLRNTHVVGHDGHSDYGAVLRSFWTETGETDLTPRSTVLVCGDARCNHRDPAAEVLADIAARCRRVIWLNPEPRDQWSTHDSELDTYRPHLDDVFEVRTLRQLMTCVEHIV